MLAILNSLSAHNFPHFAIDFDDTCIKIHGSKALFDKTYLSLGLLPPLNLGPVWTLHHGKASLFVW